MATLEAQTIAFFKAYSQRSNDALQSPPKQDVDGTIAGFAPFFVGASPKGVFGGASEATFRKAIPQAFQRYRDAGGNRFEITHIAVTELDDCNVMARTDWEFGYRRPNDGVVGTIAFQNLYFLNFADGRPKIFAFITPDEDQAMREHGLV
ncbi:hypothetical protein [Phreatobacter stygius]|uniref:Nuclear transport factor 2 family protein n=1 Tax=Phreatobacter stygius TaxID=1940610 RepID=A0A4D7B9F4_9HYPH|nr:hypothetical protein [Phreatobacter stygius]QCI67413.1 hypothetical protein E8M01_26215 [Phreatobacter stygius]